MNTPEKKDDFKRVPDPLFAAAAAFLKEPIPKPIALDKGAAGTGNRLGVKAPSALLTTTPVSPPPEPRPMKEADRARPAAPEVTGPKKKGGLIVKYANDMKWETVTPQTPAPRPFKVGWDVNWKWLTMFLGVWSASTTIVLIFLRGFVYGWIAMLAFLFIGISASIAYHTHPSQGRGGEA